MRSRRVRWIASSLALAMLVAACGDDSGDAEPTDTTTAATTTAAESDTTEAAPTTTSASTDATMAAGEPETLRVAFIAEATMEHPWTSTQADAWNRITDARPYGLDVTMEIFENISTADAERVIGDLAASGKYDAINASSTYSDQVQPWLAEYPEMVFIYAGAGNEGFGGNAYWTDVYLHECTYLAGVASGLVSTNASVGAVAGFPFPNVNNAINAFVEGARSVQPDAEGSAVYIESWFDPTLALEAGNALVAAGVDVIYASSFGVVEATGDPGVYMIGDYIDQQALDPESVLTSALARWDGVFNQIVDEWWDHKVNGTPFNAPLDRIRKTLAEDGCDIAPLNEAILSAEQMATVADVKAKIISGEIVVELNDAPVE